MSIIEAVNNVTVVLDTIVKEAITDKVIVYRLLAQNKPITYREFINALVSDDKARLFFNKLLVDVPFESYRLETPALCLSSLDVPFEFVLLNAPGLQDRTTDPHTFSSYFIDNNATTEIETDLFTAAGIVKFASLGGDATLIAPSPRAAHETYNHLASFTRNAPEYQIDALWRVVGLALQKNAGNAPLWLNTEGSGVAWLHIRIDTRPKYYGYAKYKAV